MHKCLYVRTFFLPALTTLWDQQEMTQEHGFVLHCKPLILKLTVLPVYPFGNVHGTVTEDASRAFIVAIS